MAYKLTHPDSEQEIEVEADRVPLYQSQGWQAKPSAKKAQSKPASTSAP